MPAPVRKINLLPPSEFEVSFWGRFLRWAVTTGRYIIIITELVVIVAFLSRFKLDSDISALNAEITGKKNLLDSQYQTEQEFRKIQTKLAVTGQLLSRGLSAKDTGDKVIQQLPGGIKLTSLTVSAKDVTVRGSTTQEQVLGEVLENFYRSPEWQGVSLTEVTADTQKGINFSFTIRRLSGSRL